jgi:hypothetical protein
LQSAAASPRRTRRGRDRQDPDRVSRTTGAGPGTSAFAPRQCEAPAPSIRSRARGLRSKRMRSTNKPRSFPSAALVGTMTIPARDWTTASQAPASR